MMDEIRRDTAEHETVEGIEALTAHHQKPVPFRRAFQDHRCDRSLLFAGCALEFQRRQLLLGVCDHLGRAHFHALYFFMDVPPLPATTGCDRNGARSALISTTCSTVTRGGSTRGSLATQFSSHRPYSDPSIATSTFMLCILSIECPPRSNRQAETGCEMPPATSP